MPDPFYAEGAGICGVVAHEKDDSRKIDDGLRF
jgi:hypothetical protein